MSPEIRREQIRISLLRHLEDNYAYGILTQILHSLIFCEGFRPTRDEINAELAYLADKGLITQVAKTISPENHTWRITAAGRDHRAATSQF